MVEGLVGEGIRADMVNPEGHISDRQPHLKKHLFVERLHFGNNVYGEGVHVHGAGRGKLLFNFPDEGGHLWFVPMLAGLYILMPLLSPWAEEVSLRIAGTILQFYQVKRMIRGY